MRVATLTAGIATIIWIMTAQTSWAGTWTQPKGKGQIILKAEAMEAREAFDPDGERVPLAVERRDTAVGVFAEYGLTDRFTLQLKGDWQDGRDQFLDYQGRGPAEIAVVWQAWRDDRNALSLQVGYASSGEGRNAGYAEPGVGLQDWELRASAGRSFGPVHRGLLRLDGGFVEIQGALRSRQGLPDEVRTDLTLGAHLTPNWTVLTQAFGGQAEDNGARWLSVETTLVRRHGDWSLQAGWRETAFGRETPASSGPIIAIWRRF
jgi:hypothetical protein